MKAFYDSVDIIEGNKCIAEYVGRHGRYNRHLYWTNVPGVSWVIAEDLQFHASWEWLSVALAKLRCNGIVISVDAPPSSFPIDEKLILTWAAVVEVLTPSIKV
jgi:hypothetical protein